MAAEEEFIHITTGHQVPTRWGGSPGVSRDYFDNGKGFRLHTEAYLTESIARNHPKHHLTSVAPYMFLTPFLEFAQATDGVTATPTSDQSITQHRYMPPARRVGDGTGVRSVTYPIFGIYDYKYKNTDFILYIVEGNNNVPYPSPNSFLLTPLADTSAAAADVAQASADELLKAITQWAEDLHGEVLVFDQGGWMKSTELYDNIEKANWDDVILDKERKQTIINDILGFFKSGERYKEYGVPWKVCFIFTPSTPNYRLIGSLERCDLLRAAR